MRPIVLATLFATLWAASLAGQNTETAPYPKYEFFGGYSAEGSSPFFINLGPNICCATSDLDGRAGFEGSVIRNLNRYIGIKGDFSIYPGHYNDEDAIPCNLPGCSSAAQGDSTHWKLFYFLAGPELKWRNHTRFSPFVHTLFGVAHATATFQTAGPVITVSGTSTQTGFAMAFGGGVDVRIVRRASIRLQVDRATAFGGKSQTGAAQTLDSGRVTLGVLFH
jgi:hypothetical protein